ncbi:MAG: hypothetical protein H7067_13825 [Burkholderiales bacterium]|nr:hypothetical protein [Opitutaceae bacterium]
MSSRASRLAAVLVVASLILVAALFWHFRLGNAGFQPAPPPSVSIPAPPAPTAALAAHEVLRDALVLRDARLHLVATDALFTGTLVERYTSTAIRARIDIREGLAHGLSLGWYDTGEPEVRETFVAGRSHGLRTRWYKNGQRRSEAEIREGRLNGPYREWHENGRLAVEMTLAADVPAGPVRRWTATGHSMPDHLPAVSAVSATVAGAPADLAARARRD